MLSFLGASETVVETIDSAASCTKLHHFDYVEIGTSSFNTLVQQPGADGQRGLSVDAMLLHLNKLPDKEGNTKVHAAIGATSGNTTVYYVDPDDIQKHRLPTWLRGCNMLGRPHPLPARVLHEKQLDHLMRSAPVRIATIAELVARFCVRSIGFLKVDTEGFDTQIVQSLLDMLAQRAVLRPRSLMYEANWLDAERQGVMRAINRQLVLDYGYNHSWSPHPDLRVSLKEGRVVRQGGAPQQPGAPTDESVKRS